MSKKLDHLKQKMQAEAESALGRSNPVCAGCDLRRAVKEFEAGAGDFFLYCRTCRGRGKSNRRRSNDRT